MSTEGKKKKKFSKKQLRASQGLLTQMAQTNVYASQAGMKCFGAVRHGADIRSDDLDATGNSVLTQQSATHIYASQKGMTGFGAVRHGGDIKVTELYDEGDPDEYPTDEEDVKPAPPARKLRGEETSQQQQQQEDQVQEDDTEQEVEPEDE